MACAARPLPLLQGGDTGALSARRGSDRAPVRTRRDRQGPRRGRAAGARARAPAGADHADRPRPPHHPEQAHARSAPSIAPLFVLLTDPERPARAPDRGGRGRRVLPVALLAYPSGMGMGDVKLAAVLGLFLGRAVGAGDLHRAGRRHARRSARDRPQGRARGPQDRGARSARSSPSAASSPCSRATRWSTGTSTRSLRPRTPQETCGVCRYPKRYEGHQPAPPGPSRRVLGRGPEGAGRRAGRHRRLRRARRARRLRGRARRVRPDHQHGQGPPGEARDGYRQGGDHDPARQSAEAVRRFRGDGPDPHPDRQGPRVLALRLGAGDA